MQSCSTHGSILVVIAGSVFVGAHKLEAAIEDRTYRGRADIARQYGFTRARVTQILNLVLLAPDIQAQIAFLESVDGVELLSERALRDAI